MTIYQKVKNALTALNIPVEALNYTGTAPVYVVVEMYLSNARLKADDKTAIKTTYANVTLIGEGNILATAELMTNYLEAAGFGITDEHHEYTDGLTMHVTRISDYTEVE